MHGPDHDAQVERLEREIGMLLRRSRSVLRALAPTVHPDVDGSAYAVLLVVRRRAPVRLVELAEEFGLDKSTMSRQVSGLLGLGLLRRHPDPQDGRAFLLELSDTGAERVAEVGRARHAVWAERLESWTTGDIAALADGLERLAATLPAPDPPSVA